MSISRTADTDDDGTGTTGTIHNNAWKTAIYDAIDALVGNWTAISFSAGNFTANGAMTWTVASGDVLLNRYQIINKTLHWQCTLTTTTVAGTPNTQLLIAIPTGTFASVYNIGKVAYASDNGTIRDAIMAPADGTHLAITLTSAGNWAAATNATAIYFQGFFELA